ncbi:MAG TPA: hypothetical protein VEO54_20620 [Thermoanaerobaculia bacterium]|nr:hypothetical protein [Thermoanaerobaculia bacterium]
MAVSPVTELETELRFFNQHRTRLLQDASGKFALIKGESVIGIFDSDTAAIRHGYQTLGNVPFLVKKVTEVDIPLNFTSFHLGV